MPMPTDRQLEEAAHMLHAAGYRIELAPGKMRNRVGHEASIRLHVHPTAMDAFQRGYVDGYFGLDDEPYAQTSYQDAFAEGRNLGHASRKTER